MVWDVDVLDDWDVYYERGRKPRYSIINYEAARSEVDCRRKVLLARVMRYRGKGRGARGYGRRGRERERCLCERAT